MSEEKPSMNETIGFRATNELKTKISNMADAMEISDAQVIRDAVKLHLRRWKKYGGGDLYDFLVKEIKREL